MGWTSMHRPPGLSHLEFFQQQWGKGIKVLDCASQGTTVFCRCQVVGGTQDGKTFAMVVETSNHPSDLYNFTWKEIDESMGPYQVRCPLRIIEGLDPPENDDAAEWRDKVREYNARRMSTPRVGWTIKLETPLKFTNGYTGDTFRVVRKGKRGIAFEAPTGGRYLISKIRERPYSVVTPVGITP